MRWLTQVFAIGARLAFYVAVLAWVIIGQIKVPHIMYSDAGDKRPKAMGAGMPKETPPAAG